MKLSILLLAATLSLTLSAPSPQRFGFGSRGQSVGRSQNTNTRFFTGNTAIDSAAAGAALGLATQYIGNQIFNPCRNTNRNTNSNTRFFGGNDAFTNGLLGFVGGYVGGQLINNAQGNPCG